MYKIYYKTTLLYVLFNIYKLFLYVELIHFFYKFEIF